MNEILGRTVGERIAADWVVMIVALVVWGRCSSTSCGWIAGCGSWKNHETKAHHRIAARARPHRLRRHGIQEVADAVHLVLRGAARRHERAGQRRAGRPAKVHYDAEHTELVFALKDDKNEVMNVVYKGVKPVNFEQATNVVAIGTYKDGKFTADQLLVKCPSKYQATADKAAASGPARSAAPAADKVPAAEPAAAGGSPDVHGTPLNFGIALTSWWSPSRRAPAHSSGARASTPWNARPGPLRTPGPWTRHARAVACAAVHDARLPVRVRGELLLEGDGDALRVRLVLGRAGGDVLLWALLARCWGLLFRVKSRIAPTAIFFANAPRSSSVPDAGPFRPADRARRSTATGSTRCCRTRG